jgi:hypothetical protein
MMPGEPVRPGDPVDTIGAPPPFAVRWLPTLGIAAGFVVVLLIAGFQSGILGPGRSPAASGLLESPVTGVVVAVDSAGLGDVRDFVVRVADGTTVTLAVGQLENATEFSPSHLVEHMASSEPIRAWYRIENGSPVAYRLEDAPPATSEPTAS